MQSYYWIKVYHQVLDDPKMALLSDTLWRRTIELWLVAGKTRRDTHLGRLPPIEKVAWLLRRIPEDIEADLVELAKHGLVENRGGHWFVHNFDKRQGASPAKDRMSAYRERQRYAEGLDDGDDPVAQALQRVTPEIESEEDASQE